MIQINQKWDKILEVLFEHPDNQYTIREISKKTKIPSSSVQRYVKKLRSSGIINEENKVVTSPYVKFLKTNLLIEKLIISGVIEYLDKELNASAIIVFGSARKGEYDKESDIDLFIESTKKKQANVSEYEKKIGHPIHLFVQKDINDLQPHLLNNIINGIKLAGYITLK